MPNNPRSASVDPDPRGLLGRWELDRRVADRLSGSTGRMRGSLTVSVHPSTLDSSSAPSPSLGLRWQEEGTLQWEGRCLSACRVLTLRQFEGEWWMTFENGGLFHRWHPGELLEHPCGADRYVGRLRLDPEGTQMRILWEVTGPRKSQRIFTRYRRVDSSLASPRIDDPDAL